MICATDIADIIEQAKGPVDLIAEKFRDELLWTELAQYVDPAVWDMDHWEGFKKWHGMEVRSRLDKVYYQVVHYGHPYKEMIGRLIHVTITRHPGEYVTYISSHPVFGKSNAQFCYASSENFASLVRLFLKSTL